MEYPKISVIVPVYNAKKYLNRCIDSILVQTFSDFEVLLVDDGSTDNSLTICEEYAHKDQRVRFFHKDNGGVSSARNMGLRNAIGEWVLFVDSDDTVPVDSFHKMIKLVKEGIDFVMGGYTIVDTDGNPTYSCHEKLSFQATKEDIISLMYKPRYYRYWGYVCSKMYRKSLLDSLGIVFDEAVFFNEDRLFCVEYLCQIKGYAQVTLDSCYNYYENGFGAMSSTEKSFNVKYLTDYEAYLKMHSYIKQYTGNRRLKSLSRGGICVSFVTIHKMMIKHKSVDNKAHNHLLVQLCKTGAVFNYVKSYVLRPVVMLCCPSLLSK